VRVDTYDEAVQLVNDNPYGNGTAIFTRDGAPPASSSSTPTAAWSA
jgi:acyl-CoA reductase-like NAD-dependent aldehyde dehydrogenase